MPYIDVLFPTDVAIEALFSQRFQTDRVEVDSGFVYLNEGWEQMLGRWEVSQNGKTDVEWRRLLAFHKVVRGGGNTWRLLDPFDNEDTTDSVGRFVQITSTTFQAVRRYTFESHTYDHTITKLGSDVVVTGGTGASVSQSTGIITVASGTPTSWVGPWYRHCRFADDECRMQSLDKWGDSDEYIVNWPSILIEEVRD